MATGKPDLLITPSDGNRRVDILSTIADISAPTATELNAATGLNATCYITLDSAGVAIDQASITIQLLCQTVDRNEPGRKTVTLGITAIDNTNNPDAVGEEANAFAELVKEGQVFYYVERAGKAWDSPHIADDEVFIVKFRVGQKTILAAEANSSTRASYATFVQDFAGPVKVVAGS